MKKVHLVLIPIILFTTACSSPKSAVNNSPQRMERVVPDSYRIIVSFFSIGEGIDAKAKDKFLDFISYFEKKEMTKISMEEFHWGREGEVDYCMKLEELNAPQQVRFLQELRDILKDYNLIHIDENSPCLHKR